jgi:hypothetical protein
LLIRSSNDRKDIYRLGLRFVLGISFDPDVLFDPVGWPLFGPGVLLKPSRA